MIRAERRQIILPADGWTLRDYQIPAWDALESGIRRAFLCWPRRAGKDDFAAHRAAVCAFRRVGNYWHMLPEYEHARRAIWTAVNPHTGKRRIDGWFPPELRKRTIEDEMRIEFINGSTWQLVGSDRYDALVGATPVGVSASEWALATPEAWPFIRPILAENGGWFLAITTPRGQNHAYQMFVQALASKDWFAQRLTVHETKHISAEVLEQERAEMPPNLFLQEYLCDWTAPVDNALIDGAKLLACIGRDVQPIPVRPIWGLDVGGGSADGDRSTLAKRQGNALLEPVQAWQGLDTMRTAGRVWDEWLRTDPLERPSDIVVDAIGIGAGVAHRLKELLDEVGRADETRVVACNVGEIAKHEARFERRRDELWWLGKEWVEAPDSVLPEGCERLAAELSGATYAQTSNGRIKVESKREMRKRLGVSPDEADGFLLTLAATPKQIGWRAAPSRTIRAGGGRVNLGYSTAKGRPKGMIS